jgi:hypothetical protein
MTLERVRRDGEAFSEELGREYYLGMSGHKPTPVIQPIYEKYAALSTPDTLGLVRERFAAAKPGSEEQRQIRPLLEWVASLASDRQLAPLEERQMAWESSAVVHVEGGESLQFERCPIEIANTTDRQRRLTIDQARAALVQAELMPIRRERLQRERDLIEAIGVADGYNATWETLSGIDLMHLRAQCEQYLKDTQALWDETFPEFVKRELNIDPRDATRADAQALFRAQSFDAFFPAREMEARVQGQVREMGIDPLAHGRIRLDTAERAGKRSRAFCSPVRVPDEVYLVLRPHGGQSDWSTFLHELGHALHFAYSRADLPFEYRVLGDNSVTEAYAMLFDGLMESRGWLARYTDLGESRLRDFLRVVGFQEAHFMRRYCAKLIYEIELYGGEVSWDALPDRYVDVLGTATNFRYQAADAFVDVDPGYYAARYLRAWQLQSLLNETLTRLFDEDWWRNPRAGPWLVEQALAEGQRELAHDLAMRVAGQPLSFTPLVRDIERMIG